MSLSRCAAVSPLLPVEARGRVGAMHLMRLYIVAVCAALALSQIAAQSFSLWSDYRRTMAEAEKTQQDWTLILEQYAQRAFESADVIAEEAQERVRASGIDALALDAQFGERLRRATAHTPADYFMLVDADGRVAMSTLAHDFSDVTYRDRSWFRAHADQAFERHVGTILLGRVTNEILFTYTRRLTDAQGRFAGVLQIAYRQDFLESLSRGADPGRAVSFALWTSEGDLVIRTGLAREEVGPPVRDEALSARSWRERAGSFVSGGEASRIVAFRAMEGWPVVVSTSRPVENAFAHWWEEARRAAARTFAFSLFAAVVAVAGLASARRVERSQEALRLALEEKERLLEEVTDLGLLRRREEELGAARRQLQNVIDNMNEALIVFGADDRLVLWNRRMIDFYPALAPILRVDMTRRDYLEKAAHVLRLDFDPAMDPSEWARAQIDLFTERPFIEQPLEDGRWVLLRHARARDGSLIIVRTDITELKRRENDLRGSQEALEMQSCMLAEYAQTAEKANRAKSAFLAAMSHEIRTPLTAVIGYANLLAATPLNEEQTRHLSVLMTSGRHLLALVGDILDFTRLESGALALSREAMSVRDLLREVEQITRGLLTGKDVTLRVTLDPQAPGWIMGDAARVKQILLNFTSNAVRFTERGEIVIEARLQAGELVFSVRDTGVGVPEADRERIFSAFEQVRRGPSYRAGAGLGLSISKALAEAMGGAIGVESEEGRGSCFWFRMRADAAPALASVAASPQPSDGRRLRVLIAEDAPSSALLIATMVERLGHHAVIACDGAQAVALARTQSFDLVLMDLQMPVMDGLQAAREIRALGAGWTRTPIFALTAAASQEDQTAARAAGLNEFLTKPFMPEDLEAALARAASRLHPACAA
jgi:signal transduction histidine kinase/CheY-like chemotaxis protein